MAQRDIKDILSCTEWNQPWPSEALMSLWSALTPGGYRSVTESVLQHVEAVIRDKGAAEQELFCSLREQTPTGLTNPVSQN